MRNHFRSSYESSWPVVVSLRILFCPRSSLYCTNCAKNSCLNRYGLLTCSKHTRLLNYHNNNFNLFRIHATFVKLACHCEWIVESRFWHFVTNCTKIAANSHSCIEIGLNTLMILQQVGTINLLIRQLPAQRCRQLCKVTANSHIVPLQ